jgi:hypothetical protein
MIERVGARGRHGSPAGSPARIGHAVVDAAALRSGGPVPLRRPRRVVRSCRPRRVGRFKRAGCAQLAPAASGELRSGLGPSRPLLAELEDLHPRRRLVCAVSRRVRAVARPSAGAARGVSGVGRVPLGRQFRLPEQAGGRCRHAAATARRGSHRQFHSWMRRAGKLGDQHKVPRVTNGRDVVEGVLWGLPSHPIADVPALDGVAINTSARTPR